jgi:negative regulator of flagellin synthesis FlgM
MNVKDGLHNVQPAPGTIGTSPVSSVSETQRQSQLSNSAEVAVAGDRTEVSTAASLANRAMTIPDTRMDKVAAVQQALASGTYSVSADDVSAKIVSHMLGQ